MKVYGGGKRWVLEDAEPCVFLYMARGGKVVVVREMEQRLYGCYYLVSN